MFEFLFAEPYEDRMVARHEDAAAGLVISTAAVNDGSDPIETGIRHPRYNHGSWVIVESYATREDALAGHERWVAAMTAEQLPAKLTDCRNSGVAQLGAALFDDEWDDDFDLDGAWDDDE